ncbi:MAG: glutathione S-transferase N-terminal domain-containing protein [Pseudomonadota bacterium]
MDLYISPFACSMAAHMVCQEGGIAVNLKQVQLRKKLVEDGTDFTEISDPAQVPVLVLDDGTILTESVAVLTYLADQAPERLLAPPPGDQLRYVFLQRLSFIATELHKRLFYPIFWLDDYHRDAAREAAPSRLALIARHLDHADYLVGDRYSAADAFLCWWTLMARPAEIDLSGFPQLLAHRKRCAARSATAEAIEYETKLLN